MRALLEAGVAADLLVVDDGSDDATGAVAEASGALVAHLAVNLGVGGAMRTGYRYAQRHGYAATVQVDADGQHNPADIPALLSGLAEGADIVIGARIAGDGAYLARGPAPLGDEHAVEHDLPHRAYPPDRHDLRVQGVRAAGHRAVRPVLPRGVPRRHRRVPRRGGPVAAGDPGGGHRHAAAGRRPAVARSGPVGGVPRPRGARARTGAHASATGAAGTARRYEELDA